jgi:hypothetical protein
VGTVGSADVFRVAVGGTDVTDDVTAVTPAVGGEELLLGFDGTTRLRDGESLVVQYRDAVNPVAAGSNRVDVTLNGGRSPVDESTANLTATAPATVSVSNLGGARLTFGGELNATVDVTNTGDSATSADAALRVDRDGNGTLEPDETVAVTGVSDLGPGATTGVSVDASTAALGVPNENASYAYGVVVADGSAVAVVDVGAVPTPFEDGVPGTGSTAPPTNADADPQLEDVDGDDRFGFLDVVTLLFADWGEINRTPSERALLDFDGSGKVGFLDVVTLLFELP